MSHEGKQRRFNRILLCSLTTMNSRTDIFCIQRKMCSQNILLKPGLWSKTDSQRTWFMVNPSQFSCLITNLLGDLQINDKNSRKKYVDEITEYGFMTDLLCLLFKVLSEQTQPFVQISNIPTSPFSKHVDFELGQNFCQQRSITVSFLGVFEAKSPIPPDLCIVIVVVVIKLSQEGLKISR